MRLNYIIRATRAFHYVSDAIKIFMRIISFSPLNSPVVGIFEMKKLRET